MAKETYIQLRCSKAFKRRAELLADKYNRTLSNYIETLLKEQMEREGIKVEEEHPLT